jgi:hypothetical protein
LVFDGRMDWSAMKAQACHTVMSDAWSARKRDELVGTLKTEPGLRRTAGALLRVDAAASKREAHPDGKWLLRTPTSPLTPKTSPPSTSSCWPGFRGGET